MTIPEAAALLGISADTVRRRIRSGEIDAVQDARGRYLVELSEEVRAAAHGGEVARLRNELVHVSALLDEVRRQRESLESQVAALQRLLERSEEANSEMRSVFVRRAEGETEAQARTAALMGEIRDLLARQRTALERIAAGSPTGRRI